MDNIAVVLFLRAFFLRRQNLRSKLNYGILTISDGEIDQNKTERTRNVYYDGFAFFPFHNGFRVGAVSLELRQIVSNFGNSFLIKVNRQHTWRGKYNYLFPGKIFSSVRSIFSFVWNQSVSVAGFISK